MPFPKATRYKTMKRKLDVTRWREFSPVTLLSVNEARELLHVCRGEAEKIIDGLGPVIVGKCKRITFGKLLEWMNGRAVETIEAPEPPGNGPLRALDHIARLEAKEVVGEFNSREKAVAGTEKK